LRTTTMVDIFDVVEVNGESCLGDSTLPAMLERNQPGGIGGSGLSGHMPIHSALSTVSKN
jgi:hypothetical protein